MGYWRRKGKKTSTSGRPARRPLPANPLFPAVLGLWGFALGGLITLVLPRNLVLAAAAKTGLGTLGAGAPFVLAGLVALVPGLALFLGARELANKTKRRTAPSLAAMAMRHVRMIDPARELGSDSLDEPVETIPFTAQMPEASSTAANTEQELPPPLSMGLEEFAALPGRNSVWVEEPLPVEIEGAIVSGEAPVASAPTPAPAPTAVRPAAPSATERLRAVPPDELSLVQMVERFAAALHEHQSAPSRQGRHTSAAPREQALADALKSLAAIAGEDQVKGENEPLRKALERLQELRGAA
jgi:hypothetical protein